ncbi:tRNA pseudouridine(65) synthase TruC [Avibacterium paragallinarum]|uniref:tRNA pseudouridine synthase C n=1 Tax=Avibacterium paragallinarum TaxID=728 RepID=A0A0F5EYF7_AVIPA|nr:tRNA pseudouridine(65) synthase TruC [Avibacterium paragallinarum]KAA6208323.1 tRNA pseudouridine(65) synthase TruC [Avibacterium paragallinarum]KKB01623.1 pseudouridine synthase [Avibacterium paragallinarum]RZN59709.1 tRNA pseudouridine(65) synthase TruC [Avibacterium paragallinarum]RZN69265.1 tRNA pseudouridine(65) synthase TruC [Avibacterium paragallinarum]SUU97413.1 tRNA pseudouridine synthase C [Avibacterium paragallinarum]
MTALNILYQDEYLVAVNKPAGMLVHRSWLDRHETQFVMQTLRDQIGQHVFPIHRLDRPTSGVLLFALNGEIAKLLCEQFEQKQVEKSYLAVVRGYLKEQGRIDYPLKVQLDKIADKFAQQDKAPQDAITNYEGLKTVEMPYGVGRYQTSRYSLVRLIPHTGRKHQLRRHLKHIFHPILGDTQYGDLHQNRALTEHTGVQRLMLHAETLAFNHPITKNRLKITAPLDEQWQCLFDAFSWNGVA